MNAKLRHRTSPAAVSAAAVAMLVLFGGCSVPKIQGRPTAAALPAPVKVTSQEPEINEGSLWQGQTRPDNSLVSDIKARSKGDIVTILVVEKIDAQRNRNTATSRENTGDASLSQLVYPGLGAMNGQMPKIQYSTKRDTKGGGTITDQNTVSATLAGQVAEVLPNGNLVVMASKEVTVSGEVQVVTLSGIARQRDITVDNKILSTDLAEARVHITGSGPLNDAQRRTLVTRLLDWVNLF